MSEEIYVRYGLYTIEKRPTNEPINKKRPTNETYVQKKTYVALPC